MNDESKIEELQREFKRHKKTMSKELDAQSAKIHKLENRVKELELKDKKFTIYVNNLMKKADRLIMTKFDALRRTQVIDRQHYSQLRQDVDRISRHK